MIIVMTVGPDCFIITAITVNSHDQSPEKPNCQPDSQISNQGVSRAARVAPRVPAGVLGLVALSQRGPWGAVAAHSFSRRRSAPHAHRWNGVVA